MPSPLFIQLFSLEQKISIHHQLCSSFFARLRQDLEKKLICRFLHFPPHLTLSTPKLAAKATHVPLFPPCESGKISDYFRHVLVPLSKNTHKVKMSCA
jgi:hypothetical protein